MMGNRIIRTNNGFKFEINKVTSKTSFPDKRSAAIAGVSSVVNRRMRGYQALIGIPQEKQIRLVFGDIER